MPSWTRNSPASSPPGRKAPRPPMTCCWWRTCWTDRAPVAEQRLPVVVVLDGMSAAAGMRPGRGTHRRAAAGLRLAATKTAANLCSLRVPSVTAVSRTSLLTGTPRSGGQAEEKCRLRGVLGQRARSVLFHKADLAAEPGRSTRRQVRDAIARARHRCRRGAQHDRRHAGPGQARPGPLGRRRGHVPAPVLDEARRAGRPVILTADHGHVLDRARADGGQAPHPANAAQSDAARYRVGTPGAGEIVVRGPRVLVPGRAAARQRPAARSSPPSTRPSTTRRGRRAITAARPRPRSWSR